MNKIIINKNRTFIVEDEVGNKKKVEYSDNLQNILVQENIIESLENKQELLQKNIEENQKIQNQKKEYHNKLKKILIGINFLTPITLFLVCKNIGFSEIILNNLEGISLTSLITSFCAGSTFILSNIINQFDRINIKSSENKLRGKIATLEYVNIDLEKQKEHLKKLNNEKTYNNKNTNIKVLKIDDTEKLDVQRQYLNLYYYCGFYYNSLLKDYKNEKLRKKMNNQYNEEGIKAIEEYFETHNKEYKPKKLVRKK